MSARPEGATGTSQGWSGPKGPLHPWESGRRTIVAPTGRPFAEERSPRWGYELVSPTDQAFRCAPPLAIPGRPFGASEENRGSRRVPHSLLRGGADLLQLRPQVLQRLLQ